MRQVIQALGWGGVIRAFFTLMVMPYLAADGLPLTPSNDRTLDETAQTTYRKNDWNKSPDILGRIFKMQDETVSKGMGQSIQDPVVSEEGHSLGIIARPWSVNKDDSHVMDELPSQKLNKSSQNIVRRERRTLFSEANKKGNSLSRVESLMSQRKNVQTFLQRSRRKRSQTALRFRRRAGTEEQISANFSNISITTYQGLNLSSPLSSTINDSYSSGVANSSSESSWSSSSWSSTSSTSYMEDDIHVNRTNSVPYNYDHRRLLRNRSRHLNISNVLRNTRCRVNISDLAQDQSNDTSRSRPRRGVESEGCQVLNVNHGYVRVDQTGLVTTTWDGTDINTRLYIFSIGPGYTRIKGIAADRYIHMDEAGSVRGIPASQIPEPYDASNSLGAWYETPGQCYRYTRIQWYRKGGVRNELKWYLAFNVRNRPMRVQRTHADMCNASFEKTLSAGVSCNPNDGGYTNN